MTFLTSDSIIANTDNIISGAGAGKKRLRDFIDSGKSANLSVYVSVDMDVFDPSIAPGVVNPEPNGILYRDFTQLISELKGKKIIGLDCVEIKPLGENKVTEFLAVKVIFELLSLVFSRLEKEADAEAGVG